MYRQGEKIAAADAIKVKEKKPAGAAVAGASTAKAPDVDQDVLTVVGGLRFGTRDFNATATGALLEIDQGERGTDSAFRYGLQIEKRVSKNSFLTLSLSKDDGHKDGQNPTLVLGGMKIGLGGNDFNTKDQKERAAEHGER